ncbi:protein of unknown function [Ruminococcaceae bacterium BL-4]|nr:protein of unknown function [Ruminococcaceae bacterium BL-4]
MPYPVEVKGQNNITGVPTEEMGTHLSMTNRTKRLISSQKCVLQKSAPPICEDVSIQKFTILR